MDKEIKKAYKFIILLGLVSLFGDITYEGIRSVLGPYLAILGATAGVVGFISGFGEFLGYGLRILSGYIADKTKYYWQFTILGYGLIFFLPLIGITDSWKIALIFVFLERIGKAIRSPARDTILSYATKKVGRGIGFGIHELLDQIGAVLGPLIFSFVLFFNLGYKNGFKIFYFPAIFILIFLFLAKKEYPRPEKIEENEKEIPPANKKIFLFYSFFVLFSVVGFVNYPIIAYHIKNVGVFSDKFIPLFYTFSMLIDAITAPIVGKFYDRKGLKVLILIPIITTFIPFFTLTKIKFFVVFGILIWGVVMAFHEVILRAAIADLTSINKRGRSYGIFNALYGLGFFIGGVLFGVFYDRKMFFIFPFVVIVEFISIYFFFKIKKLLK